MFRIKFKLRINIINEIYLVIVAYEIFKKMKYTKNCSFVKHSTDTHFDCSRYTNYSQHSEKK